MALNSANTVVETLIAQYTDATKRCADELDATLAALPPEGPATKCNHAWSDPYRAAPVDAWLLDCRKCGMQLRLDDASVRYHTAAPPSGTEGGER